MLIKDKINLWKKENTPRTLGRGWGEGFLNTCISPGSRDVLPALVPGPVCSPPTEASQSDGADHLDYLEPPVLGSFCCPRHVVLARVPASLSGVEHQVMSE